MPTADASTPAPTYGTFGELEQALDRAVLAVGVPLETILPALYQAQVGALSIEFSNPRHAHEYAAFKKHPLPKDMLLVAGRDRDHLEFRRASGSRGAPHRGSGRRGRRARTRDRRTDCGFGTFTNREWVIEPAVWLKLKSLRQGADIASARLWGKKSAA